METKVLTQEEITQLQNIKSKRFELIEQFGVLEIQKETLKKDLHKLLEEEQNIASKLQQKYGDGTINIEKGEFTND